MLRSNICFVHWYFKNSLSCNTNVLPSRWTLLTKRSLFVPISRIVANNAIRLTYLHETVRVLSEKHQITRTLLSVAHVKREKGKRYRSHIVEEKSLRWDLLKFPLGNKNGTSIFFRPSCSEIDMVGGLNVIPFFEELQKSRGDLLFLLHQHLC